MFVRWQTYRSVDRTDHYRERKDKRPLIKAILVESVRIDGKPRHRHIAFLGSYRTHDKPIWFWRDVLKTLDRLHNRITADERAAIVAAITKKIGHQPPTPAEIEQHKRKGEESIAALKSAFGYKSDDPERERRNRHPPVVRQCPLFGVKRTSHKAATMSAYDPKRIFDRLWEGDRPKPDVLLQGT